MALDVVGTLWVASPVGELTGVSPAALTSGGVINDVINLVSIAGFGTGSALAFDQAGDLWAAAGGASVYEFTSKTLSASAGGPPVKVTLMATPSSGSGESPYEGAQSMAFDAQGNLWLGYASGGTSFDSHLEIKPQVARS